MAAEVRQTDTRDHSVMAKPAATTIDFDPELVQEILSKIDGFESDIASERGSSMATCRNIRESIRDVYKEAKARGIPTKELRSLVKIRKNEAKNRGIYEDLEPDQQHILSMLATAEGVKDLPLWRAASGLAPMEGAASANLQ
jgi:Uncharacterized protein conserved in bacteria (DUF2312)